MKGLSEAWNELATDESVLAGILTTLAESHGVQPNTEQVKQFIKSMGTLVNPSESDKPNGKKLVKPASFTLQVNGEEPIVQPAKHWNELLLGVCLLMQSRHPDDFAKEVLETPKWFSESKENFKYSQPIADTGIYVKWGGSSEIKQACPEIVSKFGYPPAALTIQEK